MARPIKETPILYGEDAKRFVEENKNVEKVSKEEIQEINRNFEFLKSISEFDG